MMSNVVGCPQTPEALQLDMPLQVTFEVVDEEISLPLFTPASDARPATQPKSESKRESAP